MTPSFHTALVVAWVLFVIGWVALLTRRSVLVMVLALLMMFNGVSLAWVAMLRDQGTTMGLGRALVVLMAIAAQFLIGMGVLASRLRGSEPLDIANRKA